MEENCENNELQKEFTWEHAIQLSQRARIPIVSISLSGKKIHEHVETQAKALKAKLEYQGFTLKNKKRNIWEKQTLLGTETHEFFHSREEGGILSKIEFTHPAVKALEMRQYGDRPPQWNLRLKENVDKANLEEIKKALKPHGYYLEEDGEGNAFIKQKKQDKQDETDIRVGFIGLGGLSQNYVNANENHLKILEILSANPKNRKKESELNS